MKKDYKLWIDYNLGIIDRPISLKEAINISITDIFIDLLIPKKQLLSKIGGYENLNKLFELDEKSCSKIINELSIKFGVPKDIMETKIIVEIQNNSLDKKVYRLR